MIFDDASLSLLREILGNMSIEIFKVKHERICLQALRMRMNIYFCLLCWADGIAWKKVLSNRWDSLFVKARSRLRKTSRLAGTGLFLHVLRQAGYFLFRQNRLEISSHNQLLIKFQAGD